MQCSKAYPKRLAKEPRPEAFCLWVLAKDNRIGAHFVIAPDLCAWIPRFSEGQQSLIGDDASDLHDRQRFVICDTPEIFGCELVKFYP